MTALATVAQAATRMADPDRVSSTEAIDRMNALLDDASAAVRLAARRPFAAVTRTIRRRVRCGQVKLGHPDITDVSAVTNLDGDAVGFTWDGLDVVAVGVAYQFDRDLSDGLVVDVTFTRGSATVPDDIVAIVCSMAIRAFGVDPEDAGVQQESVAGFSHTLGGAAASGAVGMLAGERAICEAYRRVGGTVWVDR